MTNEALAALIAANYTAMLPPGSAPPDPAYCLPMAAAINAAVGGASANHSVLNQLAYAVAGHTGFQPAIGYTPENVANKDTDGTLAANSDVKYPSQKATKTYADAKIAKTTNITALNETGIADGQIALFNKTNKDIRTSSKTIVTTLGADDTTVPTSKAVKDVTDGKEPTKGADDNYVTDADAIVIGNTSGTNTGDQQGDGITITGAGTAIDPFVGAGTAAGDFQRLGVAAIAVIDTDETLYTVPALTYIRSPKLYITNTNGGLTAKVKVAHVDGAIGALADEDYILYNDYFLPYETKIIELDGMIATDTIIITSSQLLVNFDLCGEVLAADVNMKRVDAIDIDGAGNLVDTDYVAWLTTRACKVNMLVCNRNGGDVAEVQIAYIDDNIIGSILDEERKYFTLDVNQTLFLEMDMNMEDDKVVSFRSNMANVNCIVYTVA